MGKTELVFISLIALAAISLFNMKSSMQPQENVMFEIWKEKMNKQYDTIESDYRFQVWLQNLMYVKTHNARFAAGL